jgi:cytochrome P450
MSATIPPTTSNYAPVHGCADAAFAPVDLNELSRDLLNGIRRLHETHGPIAGVEEGGQRVVFLFSPEFNRQVLSDTDRYHARFFAIRGPKNSAQRRLTCGLLAMNGEQHRRNRRIVKEPFGLRSIATYTGAISKLTDQMLTTWRPGDVRDMAEEMRQYMLRVTSTLLFGLDEPETAYRLGDKIARWVSLNHEVGVGALVPNERFSHQYEELLQFADELEGEIQSLVCRRRASGQFGGDVLSILVQTHDQQGGLGDEELIGQVSVLFGAAHMTTAHSLAWTLFLLAQHPDVMQGLWQELQANDGMRSTECGMCPEDNSHRSDGRPPFDGTLPKGEDLTLLDRVIKESMRLLPASAYSQRINVVPVKLGPYHLPRGTGIVFTPLVTHRLPEIYDQPTRFLPDRWLTLRPSPYAYHPFGAGQRLCIGGPLAMAVMRIALQRILRKFQLTVVPGAVVDAHVESTMLFPTRGVPMRIDAPMGTYSSSPVTGNIHQLVDFGDAGDLATGRPEIAAAAARGVMPRKPK